VTTHHVRHGQRTLKRRGLGVFQHDAQYRRIDRIVGPTLLSTRLLAAGSAVKPHDGLTHITRNSSESWFYAHGNKYGNIVH
jgi:hypothetical protein